VRNLFELRRYVLRLFGFLAVVLFGITSIVGSGGGDDITGPGDVTLTSITVTPAAIPDGLPVGLSQQFSAIAEYSNNTQQDVTGSVIWSSSDTGVATIGVNTGLATGVADGDTEISASMSGVTSNIVNLSVITLTLNKIEISPAIMPDDLPLGINQQFTAIGTFDNYKSYDITNFVTWNSSNQSFATINSSGVVTSVAAGTTNISATASMVASNIVSVTAVDNKTPEELIVEPQWIGALPVNRTQQMKALLRYSDNSTFDITDRVMWTSNDTATATVNDSSTGPKGLVTAISTRGSTIRRVTIDANDISTGRTGSATIDVNNATIVAVSITPGAAAALPAGYSQDFIAKGSFTDGYVRRLINPSSWTVSNSNATLDRAGAVARVRGLASGSVNVSYADILANGTASGQVGTASLMITNATLNSLSINPSASFTLPTGTQRQFSATAAFSDSSLRDISNDVVWNSSNNTSAVFGVDKGRLVSVAAGSTNVTAQRSAAIVSAPPVAVTVQDETLVSLAISPVSVNAGQIEQFTATATFTGGITVDYTERVLWESSDVQTATVSTAAGTKGQVTGILAGPVTLTVTAPGTTITNFLAINIQ